MGFIRDIGVTALGLGVAAVITTGLLTGTNFYLHNNLSYEDRNKKIFQKADGVFAYTELVINQDNSKVIRKNSLINSKYYEDTDNDKRIERVIQWHHPFYRGPNYREFSEKELEDNPEILERANQEFNEELRRFRIRR